MRQWARRRRGSTSTSLVILLALVASACGSGESTIVARGGDLGHIHDLVLGDDDKLLVASHTGLYRIDGIDRAVLIGPEQHDLMAMSMDADGALIASGHPDLRLEKYRLEDRPPFLGLARSTDAGESWEVVDLLGEADFHALVPAGGGVYAAESSGLIWFRDPTNGWVELGRVEARDLAIDPDDTGRQLATSFDAVLWASADGAATWNEVADGPPLIEVEWIRQGSIVGVDEAGTIYAADQPEGPWSEVAVGLDGAETLFVDPAGRWWLTVHGGAISRSDDAGATWVEVYVPPPRR